MRILFSWEFRKLAQNFDLFSDLFVDGNDVFYIVWCPIHILTHSHTYQTFSIFHIRSDDKKKTLYFITMEILLANPYVYMSFVSPKSAEWK